MGKKQFVIGIIKEIMRSKNEDDNVNINEEDRLREDFGFTSFDLAELTVKIEDEYDVDIFEEGLVNTVGEIFEKLDAK